MFAEAAAGQSAVALKSEYLQRYGIPARMFPAVRVSLEGRMASVKEQQKLWVDSLDRRIARGGRQIRRSSSRSAWPSRTRFPPAWSTPGPGNWTSERRCRCTGPACNPWHGRGHGSAERACAPTAGMSVHGARTRSAVLDLEVGDVRRGGRCCPRQLHTGVAADVRSRDRNPQTPVKSVTITVTIVPARGSICHSRTPAADSNSACALKRAQETAVRCMPPIICQLDIKCNNLHSKMPVQFC